MKKTRRTTLIFASLLLAFSILTTAIGAENLTEAGKILKKYDGSLDGAISVSDVTAALNHLATSSAEKAIPSSISRVKASPPLAT